MYMSKDLSKLSLILIFCIVFSMAAPFQQEVTAAYNYPFQDPSLPLDTRVNDLVSRLTLDEKISLLHQYQPAIPRLGIPAFRTGTEALHGIAWLGNATVFPQNTGLGCTFNTDLIKEIGSAVGDEARGFNKKDPVFNGLSLWAPVLDIQRDPRAGRFEEGYGEDPYLVAQMGIAYASGMKGDHPFYYKTIPTAKHFYAYNQEVNRDTFSVNIDDRNKYEYYIKPFQDVISSGAVKSMMTAYNLVNGVPCTVDPEIKSIVKEKWADDFFVVTDAGGPSNLVRSQRYYPDMPQALAGAIKAGVDSMTDDGNNPANTINNIKAALSRGLLTVEDIDQAVKNIMEVRFHVGDFDPAANNPYSSLGTSEICAEDHAQLSGRAARESIVLLKNSDNILPLSKNTSIAVIGKLANTVLTDWYSGTFPYKVTPLDGIRKKVGSVTYSADNTNNAAVNAAKSSGAAIVFVGNDPMCGNKGWAVPGYPSEGKEAVDRQTITFEPHDQEMIKAVYAANPNTIVVLVSSFPYAMTWEEDNIPGIIYTCHSGQEEGNAIADVLFGDYAPAGRLNSTWYRSTSQIPPITDYDIIKGKRTYMYFEGVPLYPFGHGLTYTTFEYSNLKLDKSTISEADEVVVSVDVRNTGSVASDEVVQLYVRDVESSVVRPSKELKGFKRINIGAGATKTVSITLPAKDLAFWDTTRNDFYVEPGQYEIMVGRSSTDIKQNTMLSVGDGVLIMYGDCDGSGAVDSTDLTLLKRVILGITKDVDTRVADLDGDGGVNSTDLTLMKRYLLKIIDKFPVELIAN